MANDVVTAVDWFFNPITNSLMLANKVFYVCFVIASDLVTVTQLSGFLSWIATLSTISVVLATLIVSIFCILTTLLVICALFVYFKVSCYYDACFVYYD